MSGILKVTDLLDAQRRGILFLCTANASRSQMAEAFARFLGPSDIEMFSAGPTAAAGIDPDAVQAMQEVGIDITEHSAKVIDSVPIGRIAIAVTLCEEDCPGLPDTVQQIHWPLPDPAAIRDLDEDERIFEFRRVRDQIRELVSSLF
jgi:arsenate reductase